MIIIFDDIALARHNKQVYYALALCNVHVFMNHYHEFSLQRLFYNNWRLPQIGLRCVGFAIFVVSDLQSDTYYYQDLQSVLILSSIHL